MKAKDKAKELVDRFYASKMSINSFRYEEAIQAALICVDEILREIPKRFDSEEIYWEEVKKEIEKL